MDYVQMLEEELEKQDLMYIADIAKKTEDVDLSEVLEYPKSHILELLDDIHGDDSNQHKIKVSHRNKFAKIVIRVATKRRAERELAESSVQFLFLSKEEEDAILTIKNGHHSIIKNLSMIKELRRNLDENTDAIREGLKAIREELHRRVDAKCDGLMTSIDSMHKYHIQKLDERTEVTEQSADIVSKVLNTFSCNLSFCDLNVLSIMNAFSFIANMSTISKLQI